MNAQATPPPDKTGHRYLPYRRPGGPNQSIWVFWRKELSLALPEIEPLTLGRSAHSHATFRAIPGFRQHLAR